MRLREADQAKPSSGANAKQRRHTLALGIERIGLVSLRIPLAVALVAVALAIAAGFGVARLKVDDSLSQLFRSDTQEFKHYEEVTRRFPSSEFDVLVVVEGKKLPRGIMARQAAGGREIADPILCAERSTRQTPRRRLAALS